MKRIGLTGSIGSGKTLVSEIFKTLGIEAFDADIEARKIIDSPQIVHQLTEFFGSGILMEAKINRAKLAEIVFNNPLELQKLNDLVHPEVRIRFKNWCDGITDCKYVIYEAAIIFESGFYANLNSTILVTAPEEIRIKRVLNRDNTTRAQVEARIKNQWPEERKRQLANYIISNCGQELLIPQVMKIHSQIINS